MYVNKYDLFPTAFTYKENFKDALEILCFTLSLIFLSIRDGLLASLADPVKDFYNGQKAESRKKAQSASNAP